MDTAQWPQEIVVKPLEEIVVTNNTCSSKPSTTASLERKPTPTPTTTARPQKEQALNCPRCNSTNTKFCYYNNYSLTQPRYFCKTCRRYWTEGGTLRNIPVGGGSRKNKRSSSSSASLNSNSSTSTSAHKKVVISHDLITQNLNHGQDLNLAFPSSTTTSSSTAAQVMTNFSASALGVLNEISSSRGNLMSNFMGMPPHQDPSQGYHTSGFAPIIHDHFKPALNFTLDGIGNGYVSLQGDTNNGNNNNNKLLFPFEDLNHQVSSTISTPEQQNREHGSYSTGYWTGMLNVGGSGDGGGSGGGNELELASYYHASQ